jgi:hypothetical protein
MRPELSRQEPVTRIQHRLLEFAPLEADRPVDLELPDDYVAVRFAFGDAFPDGREEREAAVGAVRLLAERVPVVLVDPPETLARELEPQVGDGQVWPVAPADAELEAAVLRRASGFLGSYGASAFVAALAGTPAVALYSRPTEALAADLRLAGAFLARPPFGRVDALDLGRSSEETARRAVELLQTPERLVALGA